MTTKPFILGTAGHIDHGKSSLVRVLTEIDPDRLPEEKKRGMTIELGFAHLTLDAPDCTYEVGVVDVPGHSDFIKNMVAGASAIDGVILVVAADDGWMPQTEEHLQILEYLGTTRAVIALTKADLSDDPEFAAEIVRDDLINSRFANAPIIPVSSITGQGIAELRAALVDMIAAAPDKQDRGKPRLPVDRAFSPKGVGTVVTGTLTGGALHAPGDVLLTPAGIVGNVRQLQNHSQKVETALPSTRTAANLSDIPLAITGKPGAERGQTLTLPRFPATTDTIDVLISRSDREHSATGSGVRLAHLKHLQVHHAGAMQRARLVLDVSVQRQIELGQSAIAQLRFDEPIHAFADDRFLIRDGSQRHTIAGGIILNPFGNRRWFHKSDYQQMLATRHEASAAGEISPNVMVRSLIRHDRIIADRKVLDYAPYSDDELRTAIDKLVVEGIVMKSSDRLIDREWWDQVAGKAVEEVRAFHAAKPELVGMPVLKLQKALGRSAGDDRIFHALLDHLESVGIVRSATIVRHKEHKPALPEALRSVHQTIQSTLEANPLDPPTKKQLASDPKSEKVLRFMIQTGELIDLDEKLVISPAGLAKIREAVIAHINAYGPSRASNLKTAAGISRKIMMPALEYLDAEKTTIRDGDFRTLGSSTSQKVTDA